MAYSVSAAKLQTYDRCPRSYYFRYERKLPSTSFFGSAALGSSLHRALACIYTDWHYNQPLPSQEWVESCWNRQIQDRVHGLTEKQQAEGRQIVQQYYQDFMAGERSLRRPLAVEGRIRGTLQVQNIEFTLAGRYDRLDYLDDDGLELIDYKSSKEVPVHDPDDMDLQIGLYYLALEQRYPLALKRLSLIYLRTGEKISFNATPFHRERVKSVISELAMQLRHDQRWVPFPGSQCDRCAFAKYCTAACPEPEPLPEEAKPEPQLQLAFNL
ncbi:MAG: PD-(D/E)XK nuclease family protein [Cyanothece sp. SIO2G6]|nr:PD-(D/E)XK nuclease family protein [Cyanothece sp. SIO2G6]